MLTRGFYDAIAIWPAVFWPIVFSSCFLAFIKIYRDLQTHGALPSLGGGGFASRAISYGALPFVAAVEVSVHGYMLLIAGYAYIAAAIPMYVLGQILLPAVLGGWGISLVLLAAVYIGFVLSFAVLLGFVEIGAVARANMDLYTVLRSAITAI